MKFLARLILLACVGLGSVLGYRVWLDSRPANPSPAELQAERFRRRTGDLEARLTEAAQAAREQEARIDGLAEDLRTAEEAAREAERLNALRQAEIESMVARALETTRERHDMATQIETLRGRIAALQEQLNVQRSLQDQVAAAEAAQKDLTEQLQAARADTAAVRRELARSQAATQAAERRAQRLEESEAAARQQVQTLEGRESDLRGQVERLRTRETELQTRIRALETQLRNQRSAAPRTDDSPAAAPAPTAE